MVENTRVGAATLQGRFFFFFPEEGISFVEVSRDPKATPSLERKYGTDNP